MTVKFTPKMIWDAWPDNDLFPFDPPREGETLAQYRFRVSEIELCQDHLFLHVLIELCHSDVDSNEEALRRLDRMAFDINSVIDSINKVA